MSDTPLTIPEILAVRSSSARGMTFLDSEGEVERWSYGDLAATARRAAGAFQRLGVAPGDRVGLLGSTTPDLVAATFGCWALGAVAVPLAVPLRLSSIENLVEEIRSRAAKARISVLAVDPRFEAFPDLFQVVSPTVTLAELRSADDDEAPFAELDPDAPALIQFTSGSTAKPKGVVLSHRCLIGNGLAAQEHVSFAPDDVTVSWLPLYHDFGLIGLTLWPVVCDMTSVLMAPETFIGRPRRWLEAMSRYGGTITAAPNFAYGLAARALRATDETLDLSTMRVAANGAEPVDPDTMRDFIEAAEPHGFRADALIPVYGLAEATLGVAAPRPGGATAPRWVDAEALSERGVAVDVEPGAAGSRPLVSVGYPIPRVEIEIRSAEGQSLPADHVGEVCVRSDFAMLGYWDDPEETARSIDDGWVHTGDLGLWGPDGLVITGRIKDMIIVAGRNLYPEDAERVTSRIPGIRRGNAVAFGILGKAREGLVVIAETKLSGDEAATLARQVATEVRKALQIAIDQVVLLAPGSLPKTPSGKLQRRLTAKLYDAGQLLGEAVATAGRALGSQGTPEPA